MRKIIIKIGTNLLTTADRKPDLNNLRNLVQQISTIQTQTQNKCIVVTSGAITCGSQSMNIVANTIPEKQAAASIGQIILMQEYVSFFKTFGCDIGQILLTKDCLIDAIKQSNVKNTISMLLKQNIIPIINENDSVATEELDETFGDNDQLSSLVAKLVEADQLILLTDIDGVYTGNPKTDQQVSLISELDHISDDIFNYVQDIDNQKSKGGMLSKLKAAKAAHDAGIDVIIANGRKKNILLDILDKKQVGTRIKRKDRLQ